MNLIKSVSKKARCVKLLLKSLSNTEHIGDVPVLKAALFNLKPNRALALDGLVTDGRKIDVDELFYFPFSSFGCQYASFLKARKFKPVTLSSSLERLGEKYKFIRRQYIVHDYLHVLLGFDSSYAGEIGVFAFLVGQNFTSWQKYLLAAALVAFPLFSPLETAAIIRNARNGYQLGRRSKSVLEFPFERYFKISINELRAQIFQKRIINFNL